MRLTATTDPAGQPGATVVRLSVAPGTGSGAGVIGKGHRPLYEPYHATGPSQRGTSECLRAVSLNMRGVRGVLLTILMVGIAVVLALSSAKGAGTCAGASRCSAVRLPAPITIAVQRINQGRVSVTVSYRIGRDGRVNRIANAPSPYPQGSTWFPDTGTWYVIRRGHLVVGRGRRILWRSHTEIAANQLGVIAAGPHTVALQHDHKLYLAPLHGAERPVAARELPLGWTTGGLYTYSYPRRELLLRSDTGVIVKRLAQRPLQYAFDPESHSLYFIVRGRLGRAQGTRTWRLASLHSLGMSPNTSLQPLGRLVELLDNHRLVLVRPGGSLFASTPVRGLDRISSSLAIAPRAGAVAFTGVTGPTTAPNAENVYLLRAGAHAAVAADREAGSFGGCVQWADLRWHGDWLLYSNTSGNLAAIDTTKRRVIELRGLAHHLAGQGRLIATAWSHG